MVTVQAGSHVYQLLQLLAISVEIPASLLHLLGSERSIKDLVHKMESAQDIRFPPNESVLRTKLLSVSGQREKRNIRLTKSALPLLDGLHPGALEYYLRVSKNHQLSGGHYHIDRSHRVGEVIAMTMMAELEFRPYILPRLQNKVKNPIPFPKPSFYIARDFKENSYDEMDKTTFTRIVGAVFYPGGCYAVYNTRNAVMKWSGAGEFKVAALLTDLARRNAGLGEVNSTLLFSNDPAVALQTVLESDRNRTSSTGIHSIYRRVHFVPLSADGIKLLQILTLPDWNERMLDAFFETEQRPKGYSSFEYDARINGVYVFSHLDADLARLIRFREGLRLEAETKNQFEVLCYTWQRDFLKSYLGDRVKLKIYRTEVIQNAVQQA